MGKMKQLLVVFAVVCLVMCLSVRSVSADIFSNTENKLQLAQSQELATDPQTIIDNVKLMIDYLGAREGGFYDFSRGEFCNYMAATLYTYQPYNVSLSIGALNMDGVAVTVDWNVGAVIPCEDVPIMSMFKYLYIGGGVGARYIDDEQWSFTYGFDMQLKITF